jgi:hypothetical protein
MRNLLQRSLLQKKIVVVLVMIPILLIKRRNLQQKVRKIKVAAVVILDQALTKSQRVKRSLKVTIHLQAAAVMTRKKNNLRKLPQNRL